MSLWLFGAFADGRFQQYRCVPAYLRLELVNPTIPRS
jgi:hypothetical protein